MMKNKKSLKKMVCVISVVAIAMSMGGCFKNKDKADDNNIEENVKTEKKEEKKEEKTKAIYKENDSDKECVVVADFQKLLKDNGYEITEENANGDIKEQYKAKNNDGVELEIYCSGYEDIQGKELKNTKLASVFLKEIATMEVSSKMSNDTEYTKAEFDGGTVMWSKLVNPKKTECKGLIVTAESKKFVETEENDAIKEDGKVVLIVFKGKDIDSEKYDKLKALFENDEKDRTSENKEENKETSEGK